MKITKGNLSNVPIDTGQVRKIIRSDGGTAYVFKKPNTSVTNALTARRTFPPVNRNEPMTKSAYRRTLNRYFERLIELDLHSEKCIAVTLTIRNEKHNTYEQICERFKHFTNGVRFSKKVGNAYVGTVRFIEVQEKGFFHVHCILIFDSSDIKLTWKDLYGMWGWGFVKVTSIYNFFGLMDYLTNVKQGVDKNQNNRFTRYPKGAKIIYISPNLPKCKSETITMTAEECATLIGSEECVGHIKAHKYFDPITKSVRISIDKMVLVELLQKGGRI